MHKLLKAKKTYFASTKEDAEKIVNNLSEREGGILTSEKLDRKVHKDAGVYYEVTAEIDYSNSKDILDAGLFLEGDDIEHEETTENQDNNE